MSTVLWGSLKRRMYREREKCNKQTQGMQRIEMIKIATEFKLTVGHFTPEQLHVPDAHLRIDLPSNKKSVENLDLAAGPRALKWAVGGWAAGLLLAKPLVSRHQSRTPNNKLREGRELF